MPPSPTRPTRLHLLALCTFLAPLGLLAWFGGLELARQGEEVQAAVEREAFGFLGRAVAAADARIRQRTAPLLDREVTLANPAEWALDCQAAGDVELLDLLLLDERGAVVAPEPAPVGIGLPLHRTVRSRTPFASEFLATADAMVARGELEPAASLLQDLLAAQRRGSGSRGRFGEGDDLELRTRFQLGAILRALGREEAAHAEYQRVRTLAEPNRIANFGEADALAMDLLAAVALAELDADDRERLHILAAIAEGRHDMLSDDLLAAIAKRLRAALPESEATDPAVRRHLALDALRRQVRAFAAEYRQLLEETIRRRLRTPEESGLVHHVFSAAGTSSIVVVRRASERERELLDAAHLCYRFSLPLLLTDALEPFLRGAPEQFSLALADADGVPVLQPPMPTPPGWNSPTVLSHGLQFAALPADIEGYAAGASAARRNMAILFGVLVLVALSGAVWLWRSVSREAELASAKVELVSRVSHELKTPLALIRMYGETMSLGRARSAEDTSRFGGIIAREADRLTGMIHRILDFARKEAGSLTYQPEPTDLGAVARRVAGIYLPHLQSRGATLGVDAADGLHADVDTAAFEGALLNLLENASKFQDPARSEHPIELSLAREGKDAVIEVRDRGRGVPAGDLEQIFSGFHRASNAGETRGAGLGLSLVRHFAQAHGGSVRALPRPGGGTTIRLTLPTTDPNR